jgi:hypothetical protein
MAVGEAPRRERVLGVSIDWGGRIAVTAAALREVRRGTSRDVGFTKERSGADEVKPASDAEGINNGSAASESEVIPWDNSVKPTISPE